MPEQLPRPLWSSMTTEEFSEMDTSHVSAVLPIGATEQHGPHLPVSVDTTILEGIINRAIQILPEWLPVTFLPTMPIGKSNEHTSFPGTLHLSADTLIRIWMEIGNSIATCGIRKLVILNSHGGQIQPMEIVARDLRVKHGMLVVPSNWWHLGLPEELLDDNERLHGIHAGDLETSMMLHLTPEFVHMDKAGDFRSASEEILEKYPLIGIKFGWQTQDLNVQGACGNAGKATAEKGRQFVDFAAQQLIALLKEVNEFPIETLKHGPLD